jgi:hypothetical protein
MLALVIMYALFLKIFNLKNKKQFKDCVFIT